MAPSTGTCPVSPSWANAAPRTLLTASRCLVRIIMIPAKTMPASEAQARPIVCGICAGGCRTVSIVSLILVLHTIGVSFVIVFISCPSRCFDVGKSRIKYRKRMTIRCCFLFVFTITDFVVCGLNNSWGFVVGSAVTLTTGIIGSLLGVETVTRWIRGYSYFERRLSLRDGPKKKDTRARDVYVGVRNLLTFLFAVGTTLVGLRVASWLESTLFLMAYLVDF